LGYSITDARVMNLSGKQQGYANIMLQERAKLAAQSALGQSTNQNSDFIGIYDDNDKKRVKRLPIL